MYNRLTYNRTLPEVKRAVNKHSDMLRINRDFEEVLQNPYNSL